LTWQGRVEEKFKQFTTYLRQYVILTQMMERGKPMPVDELRRAPWHQALYSRLGDKTKQRDLSGLR